jgi:hypothetical protein
MNERIRELAEQAANQVSDDLRIEDEAKWYSDLPMDQERFQEKFAELIVRECLGIVDDAERGGSNDIWDNAVKFIRRDLQEHFGVEE